MFINIYCFVSVKVSLARFLVQINAEFLCTTLNVLEGKTCLVLFYVLKLFGTELVLDRAFAGAIRSPRESSEQISEQIQCKYT